jgi:Rv2525c-like, glycoside hydrolase-like domain/Fibronectin type III domain
MGRLPHAVAALAVCAVCLSGLPASAEAHGGAAAPTVFSGYGFDTCAAPPLSTLQAWLASPYRAIGIYIGGINRGCPDGNLSPSWIGGALAGGWYLIPLYVGLQAPCVQQTRVTRINGASAAAQGTAAADDAASRAAAFGLGPGTPVYFDMEGYATDDPACTRTVQTFLAAWVEELHARGLVAGVYGSAASTMRDLVAAASAGSPSSDDVWIAHWNDQPALFGDPYVPDSLWTNHQRLRQFRGGHHETYGGVTLNIDTDSLDAAVVGPAAPPPPPPPAVTPAGTVATGDGHASVSWPAGAFASPAVVTLTASALPAAVGGFAAGSYVLTLGATQTSTGAPLARFAAPLTLTLDAATAQGTVPAVSPDGSSWSPLPSLAGPSLPAGAKAGYLLEPDGSVQVLTRIPGQFGFLRDVAPPAAPSVSAGFARGSLVLRWQPPPDNSGRIGTYEITFGGRPLQTEVAPTTRAAVRAFNPGRPSVYRVLAVDPSGNQGPPSQPVVVLPTPRPPGLPAHPPAWTWQLLRWQQHGRAGRRPVAPNPPPGWYWSWAAWRLRPFHLRS